MDVAEWQQRLEDNFSVNGLVGGHLLEVLELEKRCRDSFVNCYHGQSVLVESFRSFYVETIRAAYKWIAEKGWPKNADWYSSIVLCYVVNFRSFSACETLLVNGYPLDGYTLLRGLKDRVIYLGGIAHNMTTFPRIYLYGGAGGVTGHTRKKLKNERRKEERALLSRMLGEKSGLPLEVRTQLQKWQELFHEEVHGSKLTFVTELEEWRESGIAPSLGPLPREEPMAVYMNRAAEVGWMMVRLLPYIQPARNAFGTEWQRRQAILDDSFRMIEQDLSHLGKKIADAFIRFIEEKFTFSEDLCYFEADGRA